MRMRIGFTGGACCGAIVTYFFDPTMGRTRRTRTIDRIAGLLRHQARTTRWTVRGVGAEAYGLTQKITHLRPAHPEPVDDAELAHKVMTEVFRDRSVPKGAISINAEEGVVQLRGQLDTQAQIAAIEAAVRRVAGVRDVDNFMHLPGTLPPNKAEVLMGERAPQYSYAGETPAYPSESPTT